jgi:hypothetical protein
VNNIICYLDINQNSISSETIAKIRTEKCVKRPVVENYFIAKTDLSLRTFDNDILVKAQFVPAGWYVFVGENGKSVRAISPADFVSHYDVIVDRENKNV